MELEKIQKDIAYSKIRKKSFNDAKVLKKWQVIIDATELDEGYQKKNDYYLIRCHYRGEADEFIKYHRSVLEAKLYLGNDLVCSIASEPIENSEEYINQSEEKIKQDCESKAFIRLAKKIKKSFPRLPIIIIADGLYVSQKVIQTCTDNGWDYIIRYKEGCAPTIAREYQALPEKEKIGSEIEYQNQIIFQNTEVNLIYYTERKVQAEGKVAYDIFEKLGVEAVCFCDDDVQKQDSKYCGRDVLSLESACAKYPKAVYIPCIDVTKKIGTWNRLPYHHMLQRLKEYNVYDSNSELRILMYVFLLDLDEEKQKNYELSDDCIKVEYIKNLLILNHMSSSGSYYMEQLLDGHPEILSLPYSGQTFWSVYKERL